MSFKLIIHLLRISVEMLYGRFPKTITFSSKSLVSSIFKTSLLIIVKLSSNFLCRLSASSLSFSITTIFFGFFLRIYDVKFPVPGPI